jgi:CheY-like chemotaxis protein
VSTVPVLASAEAKLRILVVDDDGQVLRLIREVLAGLDVEVVAVEDPVIAAQMLDEQRFDGLFLDLMMEKMDGLALARHARKSKRNLRTPIAIISGSPESDARQRAHEAGAAFYLYKPFDRQKLALLLNTTRGVMLRERRRYKRVGTNLSIRLHTTPIAYGTMENISEGGVAFIANYAKLEPGSTVKVSFELPGAAAPIEVNFQLLHADPGNRFAGQFLQLKESEKKAIQDFVNRQPELKVPTRAQ